MQGSWRTSLWGALSILGTLISQVALPMLDADPLTVPDLTIVWPLLAGGIGLIFARDNKVSSEQAGAGIVVSPGRTNGGLLPLILVALLLTLPGCTKPVGTVNADYNSTTGETIVSAGIEFRKLRDAQIAACKAATKQQMIANMEAFTAEQNRLNKQCAECNHLAEVVQLAPVTPPTVNPSCPNGVCPIRPPTTVPVGTQIPVSVISEPGDDAIIASILAQSDDETRALAPVSGDRAVIFGNNYPGTNAELFQCVRDAKKNALNLVKRLNVNPKNIRLILNERCTRANYHRYVEWALDGGTYYFVFNDSCHSGGQMRPAFFNTGALVRRYSGPEFVQARVKAAPKHSRAKARIDDLPGVVLAACKADQLAEESPTYGGLATEALWQSYRDGVKPSDLRRLSNQWLAQHAASQDPVFLGPDDSIVFTGNNRRFIFNSSHGAEDVNPQTGHVVDVLVTQDMVSQNRWDESTEVTFDWWYQALRKVATN